MIYVYACYCPVYSFLMCWQQHSSVSSCIKLSYCEGYRYRFFLFCFQFMQCIIAPIALTTVEIDRALFWK
jgi:hypothetical protein